MQRKSGCSLFRFRKQWSTRHFRYDSVRSFASMKKIPVLIYDVTVRQKQSGLNQTTVLNRCGELCFGKISSLHASRRRV
ncbi:hypothetical protein TNCV_2996151 [Trichonephila clavipes]|nr:hypothetical protein TNCV_2996151 [Trichonephila clavipes]